jgi:predicted  nucleic acid-binding Zn-ribbon protein
MASAELMRLWKLHEIDSELLDIRRKAANFNPGKDIQARIAELEALDSTVGAKYRNLHSEQIDLDLSVKTLQDKLKKVDKEMYGGTVTSSKEVANLEKEIFSTKKQISDIEERLLVIMDEIGPAKVEADKITAELETRKKQYAAARKEAVALKTQLETRYAELNKARPDAARIIPATMMSKYENIRAKHGTAMAALKGQNCGGCGTVQSERIILSARDDKTVVCESCHRILYFSEGIL